jgi:hypothetical protein
VWALLVVAGLTGAGALWAAHPPPEMVPITVLGFRASTEGKSPLDPALQPIADELKKLRYTNIRLVVTSLRPIPVGGQIEVMMVEDYVLRVKLEKATPEDVQLVLTWLRLERNEKDPQTKPQPRTLKEMQISLKRGTHYLGGGWQVKDGDLWAAVGAKAPPAPPAPAK